MTGEIVSVDTIHTFQEIVGTSFVALLKNNISSRFATRDIVSALATFDPRNVPVPILPNLILMERSQLKFCSTTMRKISLILP